MIVIYTIVLCIIIILLYWIRFKIKNPFWSLQPVNHSHNILRKYKKPGVIWDYFYIQKFMNPISVKTTPWHKFNKKIEFQQFIQKHFLNQHKFKYLPIMKKHIEPYYINDSNAYVSIYILNKLFLGTITNRTLRIHIDNSSFNVSYIDYLCVHKGHRKRCVAPELIQTHEYFQRTKSNSKHLVSFFKKEGKLHNFTPLVEYHTFTYNIHKLFFPTKPIPSPFKIISLLEFKNIYPHLESIKKSYSCFVIPQPETISALIERKSILIYGILNMKTQEIQATYWFRNTGFYINSDKPNVECFASMFDKNISEEVFVHGFFEALDMIKSDYNYLQLETLSNNNVIHRKIKAQNVLHEYDTPCAYYLYNFSTPTIKPDKAVIIL